MSATVEAVTQYNAISNPDQQVSIADVQAMGFDLNARVGPQADFREAEAQRGLEQGLGLIAQSTLAGSPIGALSTVLESGQQSMTDALFGAFEKITGYGKKDLPNIGLDRIPTTQELTKGLISSKDTMDPASFSITPSSQPSTITDTEVGFTGPTNTYDYGLDGHDPIPVPKLTLQQSEKKEEVTTDEIVEKKEREPSDNAIAIIMQAYGIPRPKAIDLIKGVA